MSWLSDKYNEAEKHVSNQYGSGPDGGAALGGAQKKISVDSAARGWAMARGDTNSDGFQNRSTAPGPVDPMQEMIWSQPAYEESVYGEGGYDPEKFGYGREDYDVGSITGYDVGGYDVAQRGGLQGYDPTQVEAMNFDPYRRNKLQDVSATSASGLASAQGNLARTGGMSASDRMAMASQFNRDKIAGRSQSLGQTDELEAANRFQVGRENAQAQTGADRYLAGQENLGMFTDQRMQTDANRYLAGAENTAAQELNQAQNVARMGNVDSRNAYQRAQAERRYGEAQDLYGGRKDDWTTRGQVMSGNPGLDYGERKEPVQYGYR